jgi:hypothetical protein
LRSVESPPIWYPWNHVDCRLGLIPGIVVFGSFLFCCPRANGAERRSGHKPGPRVLIPPGYLHPEKRFIKDHGRGWTTVLSGWSSSLNSKYVADCHE